MAKKKITKKKKLLLSLTALVLVAAIGVGIFFLAKGGSEPVNVYSFQFIGMTEYWGDSQESYGPVSTDKIQTIFLSETQTVTEVKVQSGDTVKKGDVLLTFDTTLDSLSLERKRLEVEKVKVQIQAAAERLEEVYELIPYYPPEVEEEEVDLGEELKDKLYKISEDEVYDGSTMEKALICWMQKDVPVTDAILQELYETALDFQLKNAENAQKEPVAQPQTSASALPEDTELPPAAPEVTSQLPTENTPQEPLAAEIPTFSVPLLSKCNGETMEEQAMVVGAEGYFVPDAYSLSGKTYWLTSAKRISDGAVLTDLKIPAYPQEEAARQEWEALWSAGVSAEYIRSVSFTASRMEDGALVELQKDSTVKLEVDKDAVFLLSSFLDQAPEGTACKFEISPADGILKASANGNFLTLTGRPEETTAAPVPYTVKVMHTFPGNQGQERAVAEEFTFQLQVVDTAPVKKGEFYVIFKSTEDNFQKSIPYIWQGAKVLVYEDGFGMTLFDASALEDHTLPPPEEIEIELPEIDPNNLYTGEQIEEMKKELTKTIHDQKAKLKMVEAEYAIMERELGDGNIYADIDGEVISVLTQEEAKDTEQPIVKVSGGGGFYVEGSVSELEKNNLKIGQEVTINDWRNGGVYTGEVRSIGDFPSSTDSWNGIGNPNASYYPFRVFVDGSADLQQGSYVSMTYSTSSAEHGVYLESPFILTEQGNSYVYAMGADGKLEKRPVTVGKSLWGTYKEILSGVTEEDFLAFPYGKDVKEGAPAVESDISALYSY